MTGKDGRLQQHHQVPINNASQRLRLSELEVERRKKELERQLAATDVGPGLSLFSKQSKVMVWRPNLTMTQAQPNLTRSVRRLDQGGTGPARATLSSSALPCRVRGATAGTGKKPPKPSSPLLRASPATGNPRSAPTHGSAAAGARQLPLRR